MKLELELELAMDTTRNSKTNTRSVDGILEQARDGQFDVANFYLSTRFSLGPLEFVSAMFNSSSRQQDKQVNLAIRLRADGKRKRGREREQQAAAMH